MNTARPQSSMLLNTNDPIQVHLLVETALDDSKEFEILSPEEVDELKRLCRSLSQRIDQTRQNLAIQSKYRDAAISMSKLYSSSDKKRRSDNGDDEPKQRRSLLGHRSRNSESIKEAELERVASERKCEELARELWDLEKRLMEPQKRLLQHTAGILQMTHGGPAKTPKPKNNPRPGIPGSPESLYTYTNARTSMEPSKDEDLFDDRSLYREFDRDGSTQRDSWDLAGSTVSNSTGHSREQASEYIKTITTTEQKLESLNNRLREVIVKANPQRQPYSIPPRAAANETNSAPGKMLTSHLDYLEQGIKAFDNEHSRSKAVRQDFDLETEEMVEEINQRIRELLLPFDSSRPLTPRLSGRSLKEQLVYFQNSIGTIEKELQRAASEHSKKVDAQQDNMKQVETVLMGLWDIIQSGEEDRRQRKLQERQNRAQNGMGDDPNDLSGEELDGPPEPFTLQNFSAKIQRMFTEVSNLKDQKKVLQRQIKQQRELNKKSEGDKDAQLVQLEADLDRTQKDQEMAEKQANDLQSQLIEVMERLNEARRESTQRGLEKTRRGEAESAAIQALESKLSQRNDEIIKLEEELQDLKDDQSMRNAEVQSRLADAGSKVESLKSQLEEAGSKVEVLKSQLAEAGSKFEVSKSQVAEAGLKVEVLTSQLARVEEEAASFKKQFEDKEVELENSNMEIARLQTEVTIARAELDGAYGTRAQRAAEVAANPAIQKEIDTLMTRNRTLMAELDTLRAQSASNEQVVELKRELGETIEEYEVMTKASIEWEKEREALEREVDKLRDEREALETKLADEQVRWLGVKSPGVENPGAAIGAGATSTNVLKNEFKRLMRDTKAESAKALRVSSSFSSFLRGHFLDYHLMVY
jgi:hypothetical protein